MAVEQSRISLFFRGLVHVKSVARYPTITRSIGACLIVMITMPRAAVAAVRARRSTSAVGRFPLWTKLRHWLRSVFRVEQMAA